MQQYLQKKQQGFCMTFLLLFSILLVSLVPFFRYLNVDGWPQGKESYYHMRMAEYIIENGIPEKDAGSVLSIPYTINPLDIIVGFFGKIIGINNAAIILPLLLGMVTLFLLYNILTIIFPVIKQRLLATIFIAASPVFFSAFSQASNLSLISFLITAGLWCFLQKGKIQWVSLLIFPQLFFYDIFHTIIAMLLVGYVGYKQKERKKLYFLWGFLSIGLLLIIWTKKIILPLKIHGFLELIQVLLADVGAPLGMSLFAIILGSIGLKYLWREKKITWKEPGFIFLFLGLMLFRSNEYALYLNIVLAILTTIGFIHLTKKEWKLQNLQKITLFLLILGIMYSGTATVTRLATDFPDTQTIEALQWIEEKTPEDAILLTAPEYGFIAEQVTKRRVLLDERGQATEEGQRMQNQIETIFHAKREETALKLLERYDVDYILIFEEMKGGKVLIEGENFKKVFENSKVKVWKVSYNEK